MGTKGSLDDGSNSSQIAYQLVKRSIADPSFIEKYKNVYKGNAAALAEHEGILDENEAQQAIELIDLLISGQDSHSEIQRLQDDRSNSSQIAYQLVKRSIADPSFIEKYKNVYRGNPAALAEQEGITDKNEAQQAIDLIDLLIAAQGPHSEIQRLLDDQVKTTMQTADKFKAGLQTTVDQIEKGFNTTMWMYTIAFYLGVGLIALSVIFAIITKGSLLSLALGGLGMSDIIAYFITKPPQDLQRSRADLTQLQAAFFNWFTDAYNWNAYLANQGDNLDLTLLKEVSSTMLENTDKTIAMIENYCEWVPQRMNFTRG